MKQQQLEAIRNICRDLGSDRSRLMDIVLRVQEETGSLSDDVVDLVSDILNLPRVEIESLISFYAFLGKEEQGRIVIRLCNDIIDRMQGAERVQRAFEEELGIRVGESTPDGKFSLTHTPCMGMSDQAPAALINGVVFTQLSTDAARRIVRGLRDDLDPRVLVQNLGDGNNAHPLVNAMVENNIRKAGPVIFSPMEPGEALKVALKMTPAEMIRSVKTARLRGRGGAGFPTGMKWEFTRSSADPTRYVICNADEGEPGTFKDRVILTERPDLIIEGMTIAGYAIGAALGIIYLRGEYAYLRKFLESVLQERRRNNLLGKEILGKKGFDFDVRIQMGAGSYVCGEETALISSCEGRRGDPKNRPPFPAQHGYLGHPTSVNNVETFCCAARIAEHGPAWFSSLGSEQSTGTKLLSVSGDCRQPGVYEMPLGVKLSQVLEITGGEGARFVQVGGPSGQMVGPVDFERKICYDDLATGGAIMVFGPKRDPLEVAHAFLEFFVEESCGYCTPCRAGTILLRDKLRSVLSGKADTDTLDYLETLSETVRKTSRCGLGQTAPNPVLSTLHRFRESYLERLIPAPRGFQPEFDLEEASRVS